MIYYLVLVNIISFIIYGIDKYLAIKKRRRVSEKNLILLSFIGGSIGSILAMNLFHHKTKKKKFNINYFFLLIQIYIVIKVVS